MSLAEREARRRRILDRSYQLGKQFHEKTVDETDFTGVAIVSESFPHIPGCISCDVLDRLGAFRGCRGCDC